MARLSVSRTGRFYPLGDIYGSVIRLPSSCSSSFLRNVPRRQSTDVSGISSMSPFASLAASSNALNFHNAKRSSQAGTACSRHQWVKYVPGEEFYPTFLFKETRWRYCIALTINFLRSLFFPPTKFWTPPLHIKYWCRAQTSVAKDQDHKGAWGGTRVRCKAGKKNSYRFNFQYVTEWTTMCSQNTMGAAKTQCAAKPQCAAKTQCAAKPQCAA